jgi:hypothetical protein
MWCVRAASIVCCLAGCGDETLLIVQVRTDYEPVADFDAIEVAVADRLVTAPAAPSEPYRDGVRIAEFEGLIEGPTVVSARLLVGRATVAARNESVTVGSRTAITIDLTRGCLDCADGGFDDGGFDAGSRDGGIDDSGLDAATPDAGFDAGGACPGCPGDCCEGVCVDLETDDGNCGGCGRVCGVLALCCGGECHPPGAPSCLGCEPECGEGLACCDAICIDTSSDETNCGTCGRVCGPGQECMGGACLTSCGGDFVDLSTDSNHCGRCGRRCMSLGGGACRCVDATCMGLCV